MTSLTASDYHEQYSTDENGAIITPGKFEGEHVSVPGLWESALNGDAEMFQDNDTSIYFLVLTYSDLEIFPDLKDRYGVALYEDERGFVYATWFYSRADYDDAMNNPEELTF